MNKLDKKRDMYLLEATKIFANTKSYSKYELIGCFNLVKTVFNKNNKELNREIKISAIQNVLEGLSKKQQSILKWRYWDGYTRKIIGDLLGITQERVRQLENDALTRFNFLAQSEENVDANPTIELLCLNPRGYIRLKKGGINTIEQLIRLSKRDILEIKGIGWDSAQDIMQKLNKYMTDVAPENKLFMERLPIDALHLSVRSTNALKRNGIIVIRQLVELSEDEIYRMKGVGIKSRNEILKKIREVVSTYN